MRWDIIPWQGVNTVRYGMTDEQVAQALGMQKHFEAYSSSKHKRSFYGNENIKFVFDNDSLIEIAFPMPEIKNLFFNEVSLFGSDPIEVVDYFVKNDPELYEDLGTYTSGTHGFRLGDFTVNEDERRINVCIFSRQSWDIYWSKRVLKMKKVSRVG